MNVQNIVNTLKKNGYKNIKITGNTIKVLLANGSAAGRLDFLKKVVQLFQGQKATHKTDKPGLSSVGYVQVDKFRLVGKPASRQGGGSAGLDNEKIMMDSVNKIIRDIGGEVDVCIKGKNGRMTVKQVIKAEEMGRKVVGRAKSDIDLVTLDGKRYKFSLKKDNAEYWESADKLFGPAAGNAIRKAVKRGTVTLSPVLAPNNKPKQNKGKTVYKISPEVKIQMTQKEKQDVIFGNDIKPNKGAVLKRTFTVNDFKYKDGCLHMEVSYIYKKLADVIGSNEEPIWLVRNDSTRASDKLGIYGLRPLAAYMKRAKQAKKIER